MGFVATASRQGIPNVSPKGSIRVWDDDTLLFIDFMSLNTRKNLKENPHVAVNIISYQDLIAYEIIGKAEILDRGFIYDKILAGVKKIDPEFSENIYVVRINVKEVYKQVAPPIVKKLRKP